MNFGENLKKLRKQENISQEELASRINVSRQSVSKWETGESYPEMNNLLELCKIFHCKINDLVNDKIKDINSLDNDVRKEIEVLKEKEKNKMRTLSKFIAVFASVGRIICLIAIPFIIISMLATPYIMNRIEISDNKITLRGNDIFTLTEEDDEIVLKVNDLKIADTKKEVITTKAIDVLNNNSKTLIIFYIEVGLTTLIITLYLLSIILKSLNKLFRNLNEGKTPFTLENVRLIKKMAWLMIATIILPNIGGIIFNSLITNGINMDIELFDIVEILFLFGLSYIFEYGRLIELNNHQI